MGQGIVFRGEPPKEPVVALSGRSNVGKSSLLNRLLGAQVAAVSRQPGRTRSIYLYWDKGGFFWADMPGYGYAAVSQAQRRSWMVEALRFLETVRPLVCILIDSRLSPQRIDLEWVHQVEGIGLPYAILATKADTLTQSQRYRQTQQLSAAYRGAIWRGFLSARTGEGLSDFRNWLSAYLFR